MLGFGAISESAISSLPGAVDQIYVELPLDSSFYEEPDFNDIGIYYFYCDQSVVNNSSIVIQPDIINRPKRSPP